MIGQTRSDVDKGVEMFEYEVVPVLVTRGAAGRVADEEWAALRRRLDEQGREGFRVVAVSDGAEGRAIIMERQVDPAGTTTRADEAV